VQPLTDHNRRRAQAARLPGRWRRLGARNPPARDRRDASRLDARRAELDDEAERVIRAGRERIALG
jgi:hypothetical protein